jgi:hypothetical protein
VDASAILDNYHRNGYEAMTPARQLQGLSLKNVGFGSGLNLDLSALID